jgi:hypothetical protein
MKRFLRGAALAAWLAGPAAMAVNPDHLRQLPSAAR